LQLFLYSGIGNYMEQNKSQEQIKAYDERWDIAVPGDQTATLQFCIKHCIDIANISIKERGYFAVALSGGSTPKAIYQGLSKPENRNKIDWKKILVFWSDERCVPLDHPESNYRMAMEAGFATLPIPKEHIFPMNGVGDLEQNAQDYENLILKHVPKGVFDLTMLGMGDDGHTASLFPKTHGLHTTSRLVIVNFIPSKDVWRMTFTYDCINRSRNIDIYVLGKNKADRVLQVFSSPYQPDVLPIQGIGTPDHKALWIMDRDAASKLSLVNSL
jgi:6-phosphogluconolactonase